MENERKKKENENQILITIEYFFGNSLVLFGLVSHSFAAQPNWGVVFHVIWFTWHCAHAFFVYVYVISMFPLFPMTFSTAVCSVSGRRRRWGVVHIAQCRASFFACVHSSATQPTKRNEMNNRKHTSTQLNGYCYYYYYLLPFVIIICINKACSSSRSREREERTAQASLFYSSPYCVEWQFDIVMNSWIERFSSPFFVRCIVAIAVRISNPIKAMCECHWLRRFSSTSISFVVLFSASLSLSVSFDTFMTNETVNWVREWQPQQQ